MKWFIMLLLFIGGIGYLVKHNLREAERKRILAEEAQKEQIKTAPEADLPEKPEKIYTMNFSPQTIKTLRDMTLDPNDQVRFASIELLWQLQDEQAPGIMKRILRDEMDSDSKSRLIDMLSKERSKMSLALLADSLLNNYDKNTKLKVIQAITSIPSKESISVLTRSMQDTDEEVRLRSIEAINTIRNEIEARKAQEIQEVHKKPILKME